MCVCMHPLPDHRWLELHLAAHNTATGRQSRKGTLPRTVASTTIPRTSPSSSAYPGWFPSVHWTTRPSIKAPQRQPGWGAFKLATFFDQSCGADQWAKLPCWTTVL